jgi:hypothetical protein
VADVDVAFSDILDDINIGVMGFLDGRKGKLGYFVNPIYSRLRSTENIDGVKVRATNDTAIVAFGSYYRWIDEAVTGWEGEQSGRIIVEPYVGVSEAIFRIGYRALHQDYDTGSGASLFQWDVTQSGPIAGVAMKL